MLYLCRKIAGDGEGATALFEVKGDPRKDKGSGKGAEQICDHIKFD